MSHRIIATRTDATLGLVEEQEFVSTDEVLKDILMNFGYAKPYDPLLPLPPKGLNDYEPGLAYPQDRYIIKDNALYQANPFPNPLTSTTWVLAEWTLKIKGAI